MVKIFLKPLYWALIERYIKGNVFILDQAHYTN